MRRRIGYAALAVLLGMAPKSAEAQTLFTGSGCSGNTFVFCASWTGTYIDATHARLFITNSSQSSPASNANSAFTKIAIGNVSLADPASMTAVTGWQYAPNVAGFNGFGLLSNDFGATTTNGIQNALTGGSSMNLAFTFGSSIGTYSQALAAFQGAQIALSDEGPPQGLSCNQSLGVMQAASTGSNPGSVTCAPSVTATPEPATIALMATGLIPLVALARRRRPAA